MRTLADTSLKFRGSSSEDADAFKTAASQLVDEYDGNTENAPVGKSGPRKNKFEVGD